MKYILVSVLAFFFNLHQAYSFDKDEYFGALYNDLSSGDYSKLATKAQVAIDAWGKRLKRAEELESSWRMSVYSYGSSKISPEDEAAAKLGKVYCESNLKYWQNRQELIRELNKRISIYDVMIKPKLECCDDLIHTFPKYSIGMSESEPNQDKLTLLKHKTKTAWEESLEKLKASFFRTIKAERSQLMCENNGYVLGCIFAGVTSAYRKSVRLYNWDDTLTDSGPKFDEYLKTHDERFDIYKNVHQLVFIQSEFYPEKNRKIQLLEFLGLVTQLETEEK